ncbi:MAG: hypothetical protein QM730_26510 [Anaerolineales bacterium]
MDTVSNRFLGMPHTKLGWWSVGLTLLFTLLFVSILNEWIRFPGMFTVILGITGGIVTLIALIRNHERSWLVWLMLLPGLFAILIALRSMLSS